MTTAAFNKIKAGLEEALAVARGEVTGAKLHTYLNGQKVREKVTSSELERLEKIGRIKFASAGQTRKR